MVVVVVVEVEVEVVVVVVVVWWCGIIIQNYSDPFTSGNDEIHLAVVEKEDVDVAPVI